VATYTLSQPLSGRTFPAAPIYLLKNAGIPHLIVLVSGAEANEVHLYQELLEHGVVNACNGLLVGLDELPLGVRHGHGVEACGCDLGRPLVNLCCCGVPLMGLG